MDPKEVIKRKNHLMKSIMTDAKLSRAYREALKSPLGSTKRDQAKTTFSIMKKVSGLHDGQGGPFDYTNPTQNTSAAPAGQTSFGNMLIFPAAPKLKAPIVYNPTTPVQAPYGSIGLTDGKTTTTPFSMPSAPAGNSYSGYGPALTDGRTFVGAPTSAFELTSSSTPTAGTTTPKNLFASSTPAVGAPVKSKIFAPPAPKAQPRLLSMNTLKEIPGTLWNWQKRGNLMGLKALSAIGAPLSAGLSAVAAPLEALGTMATETPGFNDAPKSWADRIGGTQSWQNAKALWNTGPWGKEPGSDQPASAYASPEAAKAAEMVAARAATSTPSGAPVGDDIYATNWARASGKASGAITETPTSPGDLSTLGKTTPESTTTGKTDSLVPAIGSKIMNTLTPEESETLRLAQRKRENVTLNGGNNMYGIKQGSLTQHWLDEGLALPGNPGKDGGTFLVFKDQATEEAARNELLASSLYSGLTVDEAMKLWGTTSGAVGSAEPSGAESTAGASEGTKKPGAYEPKAPDVSAAIAAKIGSGQYALDVAKAQMGGTPIDLHTRAEETLRKNYGMDKLEESVSQALIDGPNFRPTLQKYMNGRDEMLVEIDNAIKREHDRLATLDIGDPNVANEYNRHLAYLYTLKGAQEQRYGNYLDNAVAQFESDYQRKKTALETAQTKIQNALASGDAISIQQYNDAIAAAGGAYTELQNAPIVDLNFKMAKQQYDNNILVQLQNQTAAAGLVNQDPDYNKNYDSVVKRLTGGNGSDSTLLDSALGPNGIYGFLEGSPEAKTPAGLKTSLTALGTVLGSSISPDPKTGEQKDINRVMDIKGYVADFKGQDTGGAGQLLMDSFVSSAKAPLKSFVEGKMPEIQDIIKEIASGKTTPAKLIEKYSPGIPASIIDDLFSSVGLFVSQNGDLQTQISSSGGIAELITAKWMASE